MIFLPVVLSAVSDAVVALGRIGKFLTAEELSEPYAIDSASEDAIVVDGDFTWETTKGIVLGAKFEVKGKGKGKAEADKEKKEKKEKAKKDKKDKKDSVLPVTAPGTDSDAKDSDKQEQEDKPDEKPFQLNGLKVSIPRGAFVAIVGRVGCGKSSFLQALTGEMRRTRGEVSPTPRDHLLSGPVLILLHSFLQDRLRRYRRLRPSSSLDHERHAPRECVVRTRR